MKIVTPASALADALAFVKAAIESRVIHAILADCRVEASDGKVMIAATNLDHFLIAEIPAPDSEPGVAVAPCMRLAKLLDELPRAAEVMLALDGARLVVKSGRGRWSLPTMPPKDFPVLDPPDANATAFVLAQGEARRLVERTAFAISDEETRYYLNGLSFARRADKLVVASTDGHRLAEAESEVDPGAMPPIIIPRRAVELLDDVAAAGDVTLRIADQRIEFSGAGKRVISKLIDGTFPDYARILPATNDNSVAVDAGALLSAVKRLDAILEARAKDRAVGLSWSDGKFSVCLAREDDAGVEEIEPISISGSGHVAAQANYLIEQLEALDGQTVNIDHASNASPIRITRPDEPATVTILMPMRWDRPAVEKPVQQPRRRVKGGR